MCVFTDYLLLLVVGSSLLVLVVSLTSCVFFLRPLELLACTSYSLRLFEQLTPVHTERSRQVVRSVSVVERKLKGLVAKNDGFDLYFVVKLTHNSIQYTFFS